jgi:mannose-6-phosphate isomerase-like protein (cupin superfamily)
MKNRIALGVVAAALLGPAALVGARVAVAPYHANVAQLARDNDTYRTVLFTGEKSQLVVMSIPAGDDIGLETHTRVEQTIMCVAGKGRLSLDGVESDFNPGDVVVITPGTRHDVRNIGTVPLKLYTLYVPPNHIDRRVHATKTQARADRADEEFGRRVE